MNPADSAGTDCAIEGQSPAENSTNTTSHATRAAKKAKQKQIAATKQAETTLVLATPTIVLPVTRLKEKCPRGYNKVIIYFLTS